MDISWNASSGTGPGAHRALRGARRAEWDLLLPVARNLYRTDEVGRAIGRSTYFVRELIDSGRLEAHRDSAEGTRHTNLVTKRSVLLYLITTANYDPAYFIIRIEATLTKASPATLDRLIATATRLCNQIREESASR